MVWKVLQQIPNSCLMAVQYRIVTSQRALQAVQYCEEYTAYEKEMHRRETDRIYAFKHDEPKAPTFRPVVGKSLVLVNSLERQRIDAVADLARTFDDGYDVTQARRIKDRAYMWMYVPEDGVFDNLMSYAKYREYQYYCPGSVLSYAEWRYPRVYEHLKHVMSRYDYAVNPRIANPRDNMDHRIYKTLLRKGCCGSVDIMLPVKGYLYCAGFNYGN